ncbi:MAG: protoglobin domain-containing protein [Candidatus Obscuribacterales bacterium]
MQDSSIGKDFQQDNSVVLPEENEIERRKQWLKFSLSDEQMLKNELDSILATQIDDLMESMYAHFLSFAETSVFFPEESVLARAKAAQGLYFRRLTKGSYDQSYVADRLRVGSTHHRIGLDPKWYFGAYNSAFMFILPLLIERYSKEEKRLEAALSAFLKIMFFDMGLAIDSYIGANENAIKKQRDALRELETEKRVTKSILENAPIGIVNMDVDLRCLECNDEFLEILGQPNREQVIGRSLFDLAPNFDRTILEQVLRSEQPCRRAADRLYLGNLTSETYWDWAAWPIKADSGATSGLVAMFANSTDRVLLQQQREDFVATLTHDLKTPVLATNRAVRYLLDGDFGAVTDEQKEILETIFQSNTALYSLVQTLLDVYRFDSGVKVLNIGKHNIAAIASQLVSEFMPLAQEKNVVLTLSVPEKIHEVSCDAEEIRRVLQNLIDNSLKFTSQGGSIQVVFQEAGKKTRVAVKDTGRGIPEENKPKLFQRFWQAGSTGRYYASTGLGLYLCRRIVEAHGGRIYCESTAGEGSTFTFEI